MGPPPPPRRKPGHIPPMAAAAASRHRSSIDELEPYDASYDGEMPSGSGYNAARLGVPNDIMSYATPSEMSDEPPAYIPGRRDLLSELPETTIGERVCMSGELSFDRLLRIDGRFSGRLMSTGDLVVGPTGVLTGNVFDMGEVVGDMRVDQLSLRGNAVVLGNVTCKSLIIDPTVVVVGTLNVHPDAPAKYIDPTAPAPAAPAKETHSQQAAHQQQKQEQPQKTQPQPAQQQQAQQQQQQLPPPQEQAPPPQQMQMQQQQQQQAEQQQGQAGVAADAPKPAERDAAAAVLQPAEAPPASAAGA